MCCFQILLPVLVTALVRGMHFLVEFLWLLFVQRLSLWGPSSSPAPWGNIPPMFSTGVHQHSFGTSPELVGHSRDRRSMASCRGEWREGAIGACTPHTAQNNMLHLFPHRMSPWSYMYIKSETKDTKAALRSPSGIPTAEGLCEDAEKEATALRRPRSASSVRQLGRPSQWSLLASPSP